MFEIQFLLLTIIGIGYLTKRLEILKKEDSRPLSIVLMDIMLPALVIANFSKAELKPEMGIMTLSGIIILGILLLLGYLLSKGMPSKRSKTFTLLLGTYWGATLAFPFILATYKEEGLQIFIFYDLVQAVLATTILPLFAAGKGLGINLLELFKSPLFLSLIIGLLFNFFKISTPFTDQLFTLISSGIVFIGLLIVGLNLELKVDQWKLPLVIIIIKTIVGLSLALLIATIFNLTGLYRTILILAATLPPSLMVIIFSGKYELDKELAANTLTLALPISIVVMTIISMVA